LREEGRERMTERKEECERGKKETYNSVKRDLL